MITRPHSVLLDAGALSALAASERRLQAWATVARRTDSVLYSSTVTLAETTDGSARDALVRRAAKSVRLIPVSDAIGYRAGALRAAAASGRRKPRDLTMDALVAATALTLPPPAVVLITDASDLRRLLLDTDVAVEGI